jgi:DNA segregation ATPase FtsK/SpoIIIE, S-DNA-T family
MEAKMQSNSKHGAPLPLVAVGAVALVLIGRVVLRAAAPLIIPSALALAVGIVIVLAAAVVRVVVASPSKRRNMLRALRAKATWKYTSSNLGLSRADKHRGKDEAVVRHPKARFRADDHGFSATIKTIHGTGRTEVERESEHLANHWRVERVSVTQPKPGRLLVRGLVRDPLTDPLGSEAVPALRDLRSVYIGRDEFGGHRRLQVAGNTAICVSGLPGSGKSCVINSLLMQWAPMAAAQFSTADGKNSAESSEFAAWTDRALRTCGDDRDEVADMLKGEVDEMKRRLRSVYATLGVRNGWHRGPCPEMPFRAVVLDEAQRWLSSAMVRGDKKGEAVVLRCQEYSREIVRLGRAVMMFLIVGTQRPMADTIDPHVRDNAALSLAFALKTTDTAVAALGSEIRSYESFSPTLLQGPEYVGAAVTTLRTGMDPFTKVRLPYFTPDEIEARAASTAHLRGQTRSPAPALEAVA